MAKRRVGLFVLLAACCALAQEPAKKDTRIAVEKGEKGYAVGQKGGDAATAFLIEGGCESGDCKIPEVLLARGLAKDKDAPTFDVIHSYSYPHIAAFVAGRKGKNEPLSDEDQKLWAAHVLFTFQKQDIQLVTDRLIKEPFAQMKKEGLIKEVPEWVEKFNFRTNDTIMGPLLKDRYKGSFKEMNEAMSALREKAYEVSNDVSKDKLIEYLKDHPKVTEVNGLIGLVHLPFLDKAGTVEKKSDTMRRVVLTLGDRKVRVNLFGGVHGQDAHFKEMKETLAEEKKPAAKEPPKPVAPPPAKGGDKPLALDDTRCEEDAAFAFHRDTTPKREAALARLPAQSPNYLDLANDVAYFYSPMRSVCKLATPSLGQWEALVTAFESADTPENSVKALEALRAIQTCSGPDALAVKAFPQLERLDKFIADSTQKFADNKCVAYWRNQSLCLLHAQGEARSTDSIRLSHLGAPDESCPRLVRVSTISPRSSSPTRRTH